MGTSKPKPEEYSHLSEGAAPSEFTISEDPDCAKFRSNWTEQETKSSKNRLSLARTNFGRFMKSGGHNLPALRKAICDYVFRGTDGAKNATFQMRHSILAACAILSALRGVRATDTSLAPAHLNRDSLAEQDGLSALTDAVDVETQGGGTLDEAIARSAWLDTAAHLASSDIWNSTLGELRDDLPAKQIADLLTLFISCSIERRVMLDLAPRAYHEVDSDKELRNSQRQLHKYVLAGVREAFSAELIVLPPDPGNDTRNSVAQIYYSAWCLFMAQGSNDNATS